MLFSLFTWIILGAVAGFVATQMLDVKLGTVQTILLGMAGALVGGLVLRFVLAALGLIGGLIGAVLGALVLIWVWQKVQG